MFGKKLRIFLVVIIASLYAAGCNRNAKDNEQKVNPPKQVAVKKPEPIKPKPAPEPVPVKPPEPPAQDSDKTLKAALPDAGARIAPNKTAKVFAKLKVGQKVKLLSPKDAQGWYKVELDNGKTGYMHESVLTAAPIAVSIDRNGWKGAGVVGKLQYKPKVKFTVYNISEKDITKIDVKLVIAFSGSTEELVASLTTPETPLKPNDSVSTEMESNKPIALLTAPPTLRAKLLASIDGGEFVIVREFWIKGEMYY